MFLTAEREGMEKEKLNGPPYTKRRLSLSLKKPPREANRFAPPTDPDLVEKAAKGVREISSRYYKKFTKRNNQRVDKQ